MQADRKTYQTFHDAIKAAIEKIGLSQFRKTSFFRRNQEDSRS